MPELLNEQLEFTEDFRTQLPDLLGDAYYKDPETKSEPIKVFDDVKDMKTLLKMTVDSKRAASKGREAFDAELSEKLKGMVKIPGEGAGEDEIKAYRAAVGAPETQDGYKEVLAMPENIPDFDKPYYGNLADVVAEAANEHHIPTATAKAIWDKINAQMIERNERIEQAGLKVMDEDIKSQETELGAQYPQYVEDVNRAIAKIGTEKLMAEADQQKAFNDWQAKNPDASNDMKALMKKELSQTAGQKLLSTLSMFGLLQFDESGKLKGGHPAVMKTFAELVPLLNTGKGHLGSDGGGSGGDEWFTDYSEIGKDQPL